MGLDAMLDATDPRGAFAHLTRQVPGSEHNRCGVRHARGNSGNIRDGNGPTGQAGRAENCSLLGWSPIRRSGEDAVEQLACLALIHVGCKGDLREEDLASLGQHALLAG